MGRTPPFAGTAIAERSPRPSGTATPFSHVPGRLARGTVSRSREAKGADVQAHDAPAAVREVHAVAALRVEIYRGRTLDANRPVAYGGEQSFVVAGKGQDYTRSYRHLAGRVEGSIELDDEEVAVFSALEEVVTHDHGARIPIVVPHRVGHRGGVKLPENRRLLPIEGHHPEEVVSRPRVEEWIAVRVERDRTFDQVARRQIAKDAPAGFGVEEVDRAVVRAEHDLCLSPTLRDHRLAGPPCARPHARHAPLRRGRTHGGTVGEVPEYSRRRGNRPRAVVGAMRVPPEHHKTRERGVDGRSPGGRPDGRLAGRSITRGRNDARVSVARTLCSPILGRRRVAAGRRRRRRRDRRRRANAAAERVTGGRSKTSHREHRHHGQEETHQACAERRRSRLHSSGRRCRAGGHRPDHFSKATARRPRR